MTYFIVGFVVGAFVLGSVFACALLSGTREPEPGEHLRALGDVYKRGDAR